MATDPKAVLAASQAMESLSEQSLAAVAESRGMTALQARVRLDQKLFELAEAGDLEAIRMFSERTAGAVLGPIERVQGAPAAWLAEWRRRSGPG